MVAEHNAGELLISEGKSLGIGGMTRYKIRVTRSKLRDKSLEKLHLRVKNNESPLMRPVYLTGPYSFYVDVRPINYDEDKKFESKDPVQFKEDLRPSETFKADLFLNETSLLQGTEDVYCFTVDVLCQLAVVAFPTISYSLRVGSTRRACKGKKARPLHESPGVTFEEWDSNTLWALPPKFKDRPAHLVIITHGIFSNVGCDMLYMKDKIEEVANGVEDLINPNVVVRGCMDNMGKSGHGVHYLGKRVGEYVIRTIEQLKKEGVKVDKVSFVGHSLGGPTQTMAVHYITMKRPDIFDETKGGARPVNFITLASPFLGVIGDFPLYLSIPLDMGALGLTGRDLNLKYTPLTSKDGLYIGSEKNFPRLILEILIQPPIRATFERFVHRTLYANIVHDGIVPIRTAALMYLDWKSLAKVKRIKEKGSDEPMAQLKSSEESTADIPSSAGTPVSVPDDLGGSRERLGGGKTPTGEIPGDDLNIKDTAKWVMPQALLHVRKNKKFQRGQVVENEDSSDGRGGGKFSAPTEASTVLSALSTLTAPVPTQEYIKNPKLRRDAIIHDHMYDPDHLPPEHYAHRPTLKKLVYPNESVNRIQERIARAWQETMTWRKVLVKIQPDSHNNIVVRRRFVNLFGNVAVKHMAEEHFGAGASAKYAEF
ncbi:putative hydrolase KNAG_0C03040 [Huiozyma naganishii CBS 8797]|uniref:DUF676 domain-containing protein n=1 Tax=Huiozyma naganishii (strain ATCC MYA-139 / BCRC 22969 / CBS 8797 / KCTC 17520 / NBRC 10181 / NCYC 3082 / Yp74L-3) TaxID=1071383 RepID=J7R3K6_HUIN7|nr:hypothetical protein KNAG_0C03040 [Kazachstania naganishii CBS 8797]CCK69415.1 hypothetical protein KNAG_0C03040 [Kazachstania naganishii CBS 8797]